jgi:Rrf2 family protein
MHIARAGQYAIRALLDLAATGGGTVTGIAERTGVPAPFLQQLVSPLKRAGLVTAKRGPGGGIVLTKPLEEVTLLSVLDAVEAHDENAETQWLAMLPEPHRSRLEGIERMLPDELGMLTLSDLVPLGSAAAEVEAFTDVLPPRRLLDFIGHQAVAVAHADRCAVYFGGEKYGYVTTAIEVRDKVALTLPESPTSLAQHWVPSRPLGAVAIAWVTGRPVVINDTLKDPRADHEIATRFQIRSVIAVPIHAGQDGSGVLVLAKQEPNAWTNDEIERAKEMGTIAGLAIIGHNHMGARDLLVRAQIDGPDVTVPIDVPTAKTPR